ncbi:MAG: hypothetical protein K5989_07070 [Lachnospiraceae bacterium]|nr:hypothetical protein [Lachnospiraceae bacterium]
MIDFEEELKKFRPSPEVADTEDEVHARDDIDMVALLQELAQGKAKEKDEA